MSTGGVLEDLKGLNPVLKTCYHSFVGRLEDIGNILQAGTSASILWL